MSGSQLGSEIMPWEGEQNKRGRRKLGLSKGRQVASYLERRNRSEVMPSPRWQGQTFGEGVWGLPIT